MAFRIKPGESIQDEVRRIACDQLERASDCALDEGADRQEAVHEVRKRCKKVRALLGLVRDSFEDYSKENAAVRDVARGLSDLRDAESLIETLDALADRFEDVAPPDLLASARERLIERREALAGRTDVAACLESAARSLRAARTRARSWTLDDDGADAFRGGLKRTYARGRDALDKSCDDATTERLHEWRKRVKAHGHHCRLLQRAWPVILDARQDEVDRLAGLLGDDHDLAVLLEILDEEPERFAALDLEPLRALVARRRGELQAAAFHLGRRVHAESPKSHAKRMAQIWAASLSETESDRVRDGGATGDG